VGVGADTDIDGAVSGGHQLEPRGQRVPGIETIADPSGAVDGVRECDGDEDWRDSHADETKSDLDADSDIGLALETPIVQVRHAARMWDSQPGHTLDSSHPLSLS